MAAFLVVYDPSKGKEQEMVAALAALALAQTS
jgi:hypothetical protein